VNSEAAAQPPPYPPNTPARRYFISDLHLDGQDTPRALKFREFLKHLAAEAQAMPVELYVLGDLFEFWYEYRAQLFLIYRTDLLALAAAWEAGVKIHLLYGNRDFAYGAYVRRRFGATVLGDGEIATLHDTRRAWLEHGDLLCTGDRRYLRFRGIVRSWPVRCLFWLMPWACARKLIERLRRRTAADKAAKPAATMQLDLVAARRRCENHDCQVLVCGHLHDEQAHDLGDGRRLIALPAWCDTPGGMVDDAKGFRPFEF